MIKIGDRVRRASKRGRSTSGKCIGTVIEVTDRLARIQTKTIITVWPLKILEVMPSNDRPSEKEVRS